MNLLETVTIQDNTKTGSPMMDTIREKCDIVENIVSDISDLINFETLSEDKKEEIFNQYSRSRVYNDEKEAFFSSFEERVLDACKTYGFWSIPFEKGADFHTYSHLVRMEIKQNGISYTLFEKREK